jgi:deoxycytidine triphosphate deaminase
MAVLTRDAILAELDAGRLVVTPFERDQLGAASIDLTLGDEIRIIERGAAPIDVVNDADYRAHTRVQRLDEPYVLEPGLTIHGITRERMGHPLRIHRGVRLCQLVLMRTEGEASYRGRFAEQYRL